MNYQKLVRSRLNRVEPFPLVMFAILAAGMAVICVKNILDGAYSDAVIIAIIIAVMAVFCFMKLSGQKYKRYCEEAAKLGEPEELFARLEALQPCEAALGADLRYDEQYLAYVGQDNAAVRSAKDLVWGYLMDQVGQKHFGIIPLGTVHTYAAMLCFADGSTVVVELQDQDTVLAVLDQLKETYPYMMLGYHAQLESIFRKDPRELWSAAGYQNEQQEETV